MQGQSDPDYAQALALHEAGRLAEAEAAYAALLRRRPLHPDALHMLGVVALQTGRAAEAVRLIGTVLARAPGHLAARTSLGSALLSLGRLEEAIAAFDAVLAVDAGIGTAHHNRGVALLRLERAEEALASFDRAAALRPNMAAVHDNRAGALWELCRFAEAEAAVRRAMALAPGDAKMANMLGISLQGQRRLSEALAAYDMAIARDANYATAWCNKSLCLLQGGDYAAGFALYEWRWRWDQTQARRHVPGAPWLGQRDIAGRTLFLHWEQGQGDTLQFCRYAPMARARGARVILSVQDALVRLMRSLDSEIEVIGPDEAPPAWDEHAPLMSLPLAFGTTLASVPAAVPYLHPDPAQAARWKARLDALPGLKVGLVWAGASRAYPPGAAAMDRRRSIPLAHMAPLAAVPGVSLISLQKGRPAEQPVPEGMVLHDWTTELWDFADTAALASGLDLLISVDTAMAHLMGALGRPVWVLNRYDSCWRWLLGREDSPWYPTARLVGQARPGDWDGVMARVVAALADWAGSAAAAQ